VGFGKTNLVMVSDRRGEAFGKFMVRLFGMMLEGKSMPAAWSEIQPQNGPAVEEVLPDSIFACELGDVTFGQQTKRKWFQLR